MGKKESEKNRSHYPSSRFGANQKFTENGKRKDEKDDEGRKSDGGGFAYQDSKNHFGPVKGEGMDSDEGHEPPENDNDIDFSELHGLEREKGKNNPDRNLPLQ